jgi:hypothetical protein
MRPIPRPLGDCQQSPREKQGRRRHCVRHAAATSWRWLWHRATTGAQTRKVRDPRTPGFRVGKTGLRRGTRMVCSAKRIRGPCLPGMTGGIPGLSTTTPAKGLALLSTINGAITPRRDAFADLPASGGLARLGRTCPAGQTPLPLLSDRGWKPLPQGSSSPGLQLQEKDGRYTLQMARA